MVAFGISALILAILGIVIPFGYFISGLSGFLAFFSAGKGTSWGLSAVIINIANIIFLSPTLFLSKSGELVTDESHQANSENIFTVLLLIQFIAIGIFIIKYFASKKSNANENT